ncbi:leucine-rich_repeat domain-containing protein [Hexamita inflata]|uniref:Leucine-rich repeat domain-containing protein n=1 Tax=Hexamita inflata TaxID=28002 RepID=A0AA86Q9F2_9EUKA|nr:leucine-rich repeat domain-containing protein [Hexamita inflata]
MGGDQSQLTKYRIKQIKKDVYFNVNGSYINLSGQNKLFKGLKSLQNINEIQEISNMELTHFGTFSLDGIQNLSDLHALSVRYCFIDSLSYISQQMNLTHLDIRGCRLTSLKGISELTNLKLLTVYDNQITSLEPIFFLSKLRKLFCGRNRISSIQYLNCVELENLSLCQNRIQDPNQIFFIKQLIKLKKLDLTVNLFQDRIENVVNSVIADSVHIVNLFADSLTNDINRIRNAQKNVEFPEYVRTYTKLRQEKIRKEEKKEKQLFDKILVHLQTVVGEKRIVNIKMQLAHNAQINALKILGGYE